MRPVNGRPRSSRCRIGSRCNFSLKCLRIPCWILAPLLHIHGGPALDENRNTRRRLNKDTSPDDENVRCAVLLRFPSEQCLTGMYAWRKKTLDPTDQQERVHCKRGTKSARVVFTTRAKCDDFVVRFKDDSLPYSVNSLICIATSTILVRQSRSPEWREIGRLLHRFGKLWLQNYKTISLNMTPKALMLFQHRFPSTSQRA